MDLGSSISRDCGMFVDIRVIAMVVLGSCW